jgi:CBS domain containing-hemolysin-like protein
MAESHSKPPPDANDPRPLLSGMATRLAEALRGFRGGGSMRERLEEVIEESAGHAQDLSMQERLMLGNLLKFGALKVSDVMVPRADIVAVEQNTPLADLVAVFREAQHSRLPIYRETLDDPVGMIHVKDVLAHLESGPKGKLRWSDVPILKLKRDVLFVPAAMPALDLLLKMQATRIHLAIVVDEYGGTDGLASIEDLVEEIVGDIDDEHDAEREAEIIPRADGSYEADARVDLEQFRERTGLALAPENENEEVDTLGGLVASVLGRVPARGEIVLHPAGVEFEILEADPRRVKRLRIRPLQKRTAAGG